MALFQKKAESSTVVSLPVSPDSHSWVASLVSQHPHTGNPGLVAVPALPAPAAAALAKPGAQSITVRVTDTMTRTQLRVDKVEHTTTYEVVKK